MTNAEKYLKDGVSGIKPLLNKCREIGAIDSGREYRIDQMLREQAKPTLTEDERVILRNIPMNFLLYRNTVGGLELRDKDKITHYEFYMYDRLFNFIENGEEYSIEELLK